MQTVDLLLERGSKTTIKNKCGATPVVLADDGELKAMVDISDRVTVESIS